MGLDGFSMGNLPIKQEKTSSQMASEAKQLAAKGNNLVIKNISSLAEKQKSSKKMMEDQNQEPVYYFEKDNIDDGQLNESSENRIEYDSVNAKKKYKVKLNNKTQLIELIDIETGKIIETITPTDLVKLVSKLNSTSGILVNRRI